MDDEIVVSHVSLLPVFKLKNGRYFGTVIRKNLAEIERISGQQVREDRRGPTRSRAGFLLTRKQALALNQIRNGRTQYTKNLYGITDKTRAINTFYQKVAAETRPEDVRTATSGKAKATSTRDKFLSFGPLDCLMTEDNGELHLSHAVLQPVWDGNLYGAISTRLAYGYPHKEILQDAPIPGQCAARVRHWPRRHYLLTEDQYLTMNAGRYKTTLAHKREVAKQVRRLFVDAQKLIDGETEETSENQVPEKEEQKVSDSLYTRELIAQIAGLKNSETATISGFLKDKLDIRIGAGPISAKDAFILLAASKKSLVQEWDVVEDRAKQYESIGGEKGIEKKMTDLSPVLSLLKDEMKRTDMPYSRVKRYVSGAVEATGVSDDLVSVYTNAIIERCNDERGGNTPAPLI